MTEKDGPSLPGEARKHSKANIGAEVHKTFLAVPSCFREYDIILTSDCEHCSFALPCARAKTGDD